MENVRDLDAYCNYVSQEKHGPVMDGPHAVTEEMAQTFRDEKARFPKSQVDNIAYTLYQSWSPDESKKYTPEEFNKMGRELIERWAPGHTAFVVTHTDKAHIHNHIIVSGLHSETGRYLKHDGPDIARLHSISNEICRANGLSEMQVGGKCAAWKLDPKAVRGLGKVQRAWLLDMAEKIDAARVISTNYDEFRGHLSQRGVGVVIENKNITYFSDCNGKEARKRGKKLGRYFDKEGLEECFQENDEKFQMYPDLKGQLLADFRSVSSTKGNRVGAASDLLSESGSNSRGRKKDYSQFTKIDRRNSSIELPPIFDERCGPLYLAMKKAREVSLFDYCKEHKIALTKNKDGQTALRGRDFVVFESESQWRNTKNGRTGNIIDFVVCHDECHPLRAVSKLTGNSRLLALEAVMGEYRKDYQPFYVPKPRAASPHDAHKTVAAFTRARGMADGAAETLLKSDRLHVGHDRSIWLMGEKSESAMEFREEPNGQWRGKRHGKPTGAFFEAIGSGKQIVVHRDPFEFIVQHGGKAVSPSGGASHFAMLDAGSSQRLDEFLATNHHINEIHVAHSSLVANQEHDRKMQRELASKFNPFDIRVQALEPGRARGKARGPDFSL